MWCLIRHGGLVRVNWPALRFDAENAEQTVERMFRRRLAADRGALALLARTFAMARAHSIHRAVIWAIRARIGGNMTAMNPAISRKGCALMRVAPGGVDICGGVTSGGLPKLGAIPDIG